MDEDLDEITDEDQKEEAKMFSAILLEDHFFN